MCLAKIADKSLMRLTKLLLTSRLVISSVLLELLILTRRATALLLLVPFVEVFLKCNIVWSQGTKQFFNKVIQPPSPNGVNLNQFLKPNFLNSVIVTDVSLDQKMSGDLH